MVFLLGGLPPSDRIATLVFLSAIGVVAITGLLFVIIHLTFFTRAKINGDLPQIDKTTRLMLQILLALGAFAGITFGLDALGQTDPFGMLSGWGQVSAVLFLLFTIPTLFLVLEELLKFKSIGD